MSVKSDNVVDDWEAIDDTELNSKVDQLKQTSDTTKMNKAVTNNINPLYQNGKPFLLMSDDDCMRAQFMPPEPTVKILRRPTSERSDNKLAEQKPKAPVKTLQQREQEYAEARLRILGSAKSEEEESAAVINKLESISIVDGAGILNSNMTAATTTTAAAAATTASYNNNNNNKISGRTLPNGTTSDAIINNSPRLSQNVRRNEDNVIRLPRGPDGTGFLLKR